MSPVASIRKSPRSAQLSEKIARLIPGGVNSPFRSFQDVGGHTIFIDRGAGSRISDIDGNQYIDYVGAWGPAILGHAFSGVVERVKEVVAGGALFGAPHELELELAGLLSSAIASVEMVRFVNSGTEAVMSAIRLARGFTGRDDLIVLEGCYHGHSDPTLGVGSTRHSAGIPDGYAAYTHSAPFNNLDALESLLKERKDSVAAVILEPVAGSMGVVPPAEGYLSGVRALCTEYDALLIFDEVLTGFRVAFGGAQERYGVRADITCFGKSLGGGMPIGAYGGRAEIMKRLMPVGDVYQAGTFSGNPVTMAGGIATLEALSQEGVYERLEAATARLFSGIERSIERLAGPVPVQLQRVGSMFAIHFAPQPVRDLDSSRQIDEHLFATFFHELLVRGVYLPPTAFDAACVSLAHTDADIDETVDACAEALERTFSSAGSQ